LIVRHWAGLFGLVIFPAQAKNGLERGQRSF
jgi:hypothetical protein